MVILSTPSAGRGGGAGEGGTGVGSVGGGGCDHCRRHRRCRWYVSAATVAVQHAGAVSRCAVAVSRCRRGSRCRGGARGGECGGGVSWPIGCRCEQPLRVEPHHHEEHEGAHRESSAPRALHVGKQVQVVSKKDSHFYYAKDLVPLLRTYTVYLGTVCEEKKRTCLINNLVIKT